MKEEKELELIPFCRPYPWDIEDRKAILRLIDDRLVTGKLVKGEYVQDLEEQVRKLYNVKYCIATSSCTMGLFLCWKCFEHLTPIHTPAFTWPSFYWLLDQHLSVFFHDISYTTWLMYPVYMGGFVMPVHTFGNITIVSKSMKKDFKNKVIYDGAHAFLSKIEDIGDATVFSLAATKIITACDGGLIITNKKYLADKLRVFRDADSRLSELHAAVGLITLQYRDDILEWKKEVFEYYSEHIPGVFQEVPYSSNYNTIGFLNVQELKIPANQFEYKQYYKPLKKGFLNSEFIYKNIVVLPSYYHCDYKKITKEILELNK